MSGTKAGGLKAASTNRKKYGTNFYRSIGQKGGRLGHKGGFAANRALARIAGQKGGRNSIRGDALATLKGENPERSIRQSTHNLYENWLPQVFKIYNESCGTKFVYTPPSLPTDYYAQLKAFIHDDERLADEKVTLCMAVLYKFYQTTHGRFTPETLPLTEIKSLVTHLSSRSAISWEQAKAFCREWNEEKLANVLTKF